MSKRPSIAIESADLHVLRHHIYEYRKGVRNLVLHTMNSFDREDAEILLNNKEICYYIHKVNDRKVNIFMGNPSCVEVIKSFGDISLSDYSPEQDFILGVMLGYNSNVQCERYLQRKEKTEYPIRSCISHSL